MPIGRKTAHLCQGLDGNNVHGLCDSYAERRQSPVSFAVPVGYRTAVCIIANGGTYIKPKLYTRVVDHDGNIILDNTMPQSRQVIKETTAFLLTDAMVDVVTSGTGGSVNFGGMAIAGKTGTTSDYNDVWSVPERLRL